MYILSRRILLGLIVFLFLAASSTTIWAQENDEIQELLEVLTPIHSLEAIFTQTILDNRGKAIQKSEGKLVLQRPGQFRWEVEHPVPQLIIANNNRIWIYDPDLEQVVIRPVAKEIGKTPAFLLSNINTAINKDFVIRRMQAPRYWQWFSLKPKTKDSLFNTIQLGFLNREIKELRMQDNLGHNTVIQFQQMKVNRDLPPSLFKFHPPAHVDVIDETR